MAATHAYSTIIPANTSNGAGSTTTGAVISNVAGYGMGITGLMTNGGTAPSVAPVANIYVSGDNFATSPKLFYSIAGDTVPSHPTPFAIDVPAHWMYVRVDVTGNTGQAITCEAFAQALTGI